MKVIREGQGPAVPGGGRRYAHREVAMPLRAAAALLRRRAPPWLLLGLLLLVAAINAEHMDRAPVPPLSSHRTWRVVPRLIEHFHGWDHRRPGTSREPFLGGTGCYYTLPQRTPIPWTNPAGLFRELRPGGRLHQLIGHCPAQFFNCMPHAYAAPALAGALLPGHPLAVALVPTLYLLALLLALYGVGREVEGPWTGLAAAAVGAGYPGLFGFARWPEGTIVAAALSVGMVWCLLRSRGLTRPLPLLGFVALAWSALRSGEGISEGTCAGLAAVGPFAVELVRGPLDAWRARRLPLAWLGGLLIVGLGLGLTTDWPWIVEGLWRVRTGLVEFAVDARPLDPRAGPVARTLVSRGIYLIFLWGDYLKPLMVLWLVAGLALLARSGARHRLSLLLWFAVPFVGTSAMARKAIWYALPIVPPLAVLTVAGLLGLRTPRLRRAALALAAASGIYQLVGMSMPWTLGPLAPPPLLANPPRPAVEVRWRNLLTQGEPFDNALRDTARGLLGWLDPRLPPQDDLLYVGVLTPWGEDLQPAWAMSWLLTTARPDLVVVELATPMYLEEQPYRGLTPRDFAFLMCLGTDGGPQPCADAAGTPRLALPGRAERPPPALDAWMRRLLARSRGAPPGQPLLHVLEHPATEGIL